MKHTGAIALVWLVQTLSSGAASAAATSPQDKPQGPTIKELVGKLQAREKSLKSVDMEFWTKDRFPGGGRIETRGRLRVLPGTHFHTSVQVLFEGEIRSEMQTVVTPKGVWTRRRDPIEEVYLFMTPKLRKEMEAKEKTRQSLATEERERVKQASFMRCPKCGDKLEEVTFQEIVVDCCTGCKGIWLDPGELEHVTAKENQGWLAGLWRSKS